MVSIPIITSDQGNKGKKKGKNSQLSANNKDPALNNASNSKKKMWLSRIIALWNEDIMAVQLLSAIDQAVPPKVLHIELRISFTATVSANRSDTREHLRAELTSLSLIKSPGFSLVILVLVRMILQERGTYPSNNLKSV